VRFLLIVLAEFKLSRIWALTKARAELLILYQRFALLALSWRSPESAELIETFLRNITAASDLTSSGKFALGFRTATIRHAYLSASARLASFRLASAPLRASLSVYRTY
jgi:hypothetical protein